MDYNKFQISRFNFSHVESRDSFITSHVFVTLDVGKYNIMES
jgi:hypothetical protein